MDIIESINRYLVGSPASKGERTRLIRARDEIVRLRTASQETINGRTVQIDWKAQALELRELVRLGGIKIAELESALAEQPAQQQEPVITKNEKGLTLHVGWDDLPAGTKIYTASPRREWVQCCCGEPETLGVVHRTDGPCYWPEEDREWVGLTDEEILAANYPDGEENGPTISAPDFELDCFAKQVEAKLKEKNT